MKGNEAFDRFGVAMSLALAAASFSVSAGAQQAASPGVGVERDRGEFADIIVTAQRREESLRNVPLTITALSAKSLEERHVVDKLDLANSVPGLINTQAIGNAQAAGFAIRGQGPGYSSGSAVITYFAEVPAAGGGGGSLASQAFSDGAAGSFYDLQSVQVLKGPQGTLFGKNSVGGAILFTPNKPANGFSADVTAQLGNYNDRSIEAMLNIPIVEDKVLFRVAGLFEKRDGYTKDVGPFHKGRDYDDVNYLAARASLILRPVEGFENYTIVRYYQSKTNGQGASTTIYDPTAPSGVGVPIGDVYPNLQSQIEAQRARGPRRISLNERSFSNYKAWQGLNTTTIDLTDNLKLKNIASYSRSVGAQGQDGDGTAEAIMGTTSAMRPNAVVKFYTEELQLQGNLFEDALELTLGVYGDKLKTAAASELDTYLFPLVPGFFPLGPLNNPGYPVYIQNVSNSKSRAAFGQATLNVGKLVSALEGLSLTAGYRRTRESGNGVALLNTAFGALGNPGSYKFSYGSHTLTAKYQVNDVVMVYVTQRNAFKSGGVNPYVPEGNQYRFFPPEEAIDIEGGIKTRFSLGGIPVSLDAAAFKTIIKNIQRTTVDFVLTGGVGNFIRPAAEGEAKGVELSVAVKPTPLVEIGFNYAYTDTAYTKITDPNQIAFLTGAPFPYVAKHKGDIFMSVGLPILPESQGSLRIGGNYAFQSKTSNSLDNTSAQPYLKGYGLMNLHADWTNMFGKPIDLGFFMTNVLDKTYQSGQVLQVITFPGMLANTYGAPRMFGFRLRYHMGGE